MMNRTMSVRSTKRDPGLGLPRFSMATFRSLQGPELSRKMNRLIKSEHAVIGAYETAARERVNIAAQLSEWGESTDDEAISDLSDKLGVLMAEIGDQEDMYAQNLEDYRTILKQIRNTEGSVQPSRDNRLKIADEIQKLKYREPMSPKLETLEQELVRAEAQALVAEAQLTNITRAKIKEAFDIHLAATVERAEKQIILARHARRLLLFLDDTPVVPGDPRLAYKHELEARSVLEDAENDLRTWERTFEPIPMASSREASSAGILRSSRTARESLGTATEEQDTDGTASEAKEGEEEGQQQEGGGQAGGRRGKKKARASGQAMAA